MKNIELTYEERFRIIAALTREREEIEEAIKLWSERAESAVEKKSLYEGFVQNRSKQLDEVNRIIDKLYAE